ncbi:MAG TPA: phage holin family protein [Candidatus Krumholzibacteria bacterium]|nr:phage holin family protein [Candidatus Krumholzibacteria bacterium]HPD70700.1 phage holin family protein [Candidatus Krumholzibacteria bacterium]HRY39600.1 phage holin family protein [Candidatus Krumholzibacteria bacterium]
MSKFFLHWLVLAAALGLTAYVLPGVDVTSPGALLVAALVLGFLNAILKPVLVLLTLPLTILTLGIFYLVLNAILFGLASALVPGFTVHGFGAAFLGAIVMSLLSMVLSSLAGLKR